MMEVAAADTDRFWSRVNRASADDCWPWMGCRMPFGHGQIRIGPRLWLTHRLAYFITYGTIPEGLCVCHLCDFPPCCNPAHLIAASLSINQRQRRARGRHSRTRTPQAGFHPFNEPQHLSLAERFWRRVDQRGPGECWPWTGCCDRAGYGLFSRRRLRAHRLALELSGTRPSANEFVLHSCDNPPCCNPAHLRIGTAADNMRDCLSRGRFRATTGEAHGTAKMTWAKVRALRAEPEPHCQTALGSKYGIDGHTIGMILRGLTWKEESYPPRKITPLPLPLGALNPAVKLAPWQVMEIRCLINLFDAPQVAGWYGITRAAVWHIWNGKTWSHL